MRNFFINLSDRSSRSLLLVSVPLYLALFIFFEGLGIKFDVSQWLFSISGHAWALKHTLITESVLHDGFRALNIVIVAGILIFYLSQWFKPLRVTSLVRLSQFIGALLLSFIVVNLMKGVIGMHCPWDLNMFGGRFDYQPLWLAASQPEPGRCFPAGHASIGYAWFSLFFLPTQRLPRYRPQSPNRFTTHWFITWFCAAVARRTFHFRRYHHGFYLLGYQCIDIYWR